MDITQFISQIPSNKGQQIIQTPVKKTKSQQHQIKTADSQPISAMKNLQNIDAQQLIENFDSFIKVTYDNEQQETDIPPISRKLFHLQIYRVQKINFENENSTMKKNKKKISEQKIQGIILFQTEIQQNSIQKQQVEQSIHTKFEQLTPTKRDKNQEQLYQIMLAPSKRQCFQEITWS